MQFCVRGLVVAGSTIIAGLTYLEILTAIVVSGDALQHLYKCIDLFECVVGAQAHPNHSRRARPISGKMLATPR